VMIAIASAVAGKTTEALTAGARNALGKLVDLIRRRFAGDEAAQQALEGGQPDPLAVQLERLAAEDHEFAAQLRALWGQASTELHAEHGGVVNEVSGDVGGNVVQARDVTGGIRFDTVSRRNPKK
jgi:hypothetical protein